MKPSIRMLNQKELWDIHCASVDTLENVGVAVHDERAREALLGAGARADSSERVRLPAKLVKAALDRCPPVVLLHGSALTGANLVHDSGWLDHGSVASPAYMVLVNEVLHMVSQYMRGIPVSDTTLAVDLIDHVGPGGHYLQEEHTLNHFRQV